MPTLTIKTADELIALDLEGRWRTRRAGRETAVSRWILRAFLDRGGPIPADQIDIAYPFSVSPTPFAIRLPNGSDRYACCAMDALGIAPMVGQRVEIRSRCHHCEMPLEFSASIGGVSSEANGVMLWIGKRVDDRCKVADTY